MRVFVGSALVVAFLGSVAFFQQPADLVVSGRWASAWTLDLLSSDYKVRGEAQTVLLNLGESAVPHIRVLLGKRVPRWEPYVGSLGTLLPFLTSDKSDPGVCRQRGAEMIGRLGPKGRAAVPDLVDSLGYSSAALEAERALLRVGDASIPGLIRGLGNRNTEVRARSARLLKEFVASHPETVPALLTVVRDDRPSARREAALALGEARVAERVVLPALFRLAKDEAAEVRAASYEALGKLGRNSPGALEMVRSGLRDSMPIVRLEAAKALWVLTADRETVVPVLSGVLCTQEGWQAAYALGSMGPSAAPAVPALIDVLKREKVPRAFRTPPSSSLALGKIQEAAIPALEAVLNDPEPAVRLAAVLAFKFMGQHAHSAVPELLKLLHDPEPEVRQVTAITWAGAGAEKAAVLSSLEECLRAEDIYMRSTAAALLRELVPEREWVVAAE